MEIICLSNFSSVSRAYVFLDCKRADDHLHSLRQSSLITLRYIFMYFQWQYCAEIVTIYMNVLPSSCLSFCCSLILLLVQITTLYRLWNRLSHDLYSTVCMTKWVLSVLTKYGLCSERGRNLCKRTWKQTHTRTKTEYTPHYCMYPMTVSHFWFQDI